MIDGGEVLERSSQRARRTRPSAVDGLIIGGREVWVLVAGPGDDVASWLRPAPDSERGSGLRVCRGVLEDGTVVLGDADPERDPLLSDLIRGNGEEDRA